MSKEKVLILEYNEPCPEKMKTIINRALRVTFDGGDIEWINDKKVKVKNLGVKEISLMDLLQKED